MRTCRAADTAARAVALALALVLLWPAAARAQAPPDITAAGAVLYDPAEDQVLYGRDENGARLIASTTKMMTALLALEAGTLDDEVTISSAAAGADATPGAASLALVAGQRIPMRSLLPGLLLRSGNDAAVAVAEHVAGSEAAFVARMNSRAAELGMAGTAFVDASGLTEQPGNRSTPLDLARLAEVAMANADFAAWAGARSLTVPGLAPLTSRNELLGTYLGATGVKTGFTTRAGQCLVASATRGDRTLIAVVLGSQANFDDSTALLDHGFTAFRRVAPAVPERAVTRYRWTGQVVDVVPAEPLDATIGTDAAATLSVSLQPSLTRPAAAGTAVGQAELRVDGQVADVVELRLAAPAEAPATDGPATRAGGSVADALRAFARSQASERSA